MGAGTKSAVAPPLVAALSAADLRMGRHGPWEPANALQARLLAEWFEPNRDRIAQIPEIDSRASFSADELNAFLREHGFSSYLAEFAPHTFGIVGVLKLVLFWREPGSSTALRGTDGRTYPAAPLSADGTQFVYRCEGHPDPVARILTATGDSVFLTPLREAPDAFDLVRLALALEDGLQPLPQHAWYGAVVFPKINLGVEADVEWLVGLQTLTTEDRIPIRVHRASQGTKLLMDHMGARVESAVAMEFAVMAAPPAQYPDFIIDRPFLMWLRRNGLSLPLGVFYLAEDVWRDPGSTSDTHRAAGEVPGEIPRTPA